MAQAVSNPELSLQNRLNYNENYERFQSKLKQSVDEFNQK